MQNKFTKNKLLLFLGTVVMSALLTFAIEKFNFPTLDAKFNDFHVSVFKRAHPSKHLKLVNLTPETDSILHFSKFSLKKHQDIIETLFSNNASFVFYAIDPLILDTHEETYPLEKFISFTKKYPNLYFIIPATPTDRRTPIFNHPLLSKLNIIENTEGTDMFSGAGDSVVRRALIWQNESAFPFSQIFRYDPLTLDGKFLRNDFFCIRSRFAEKESYDSISIQNNTDLNTLDKKFSSGSWVFVSLYAKFDLFDYRKIPYDHSPYAMNYNEVLANTFDTFLLKDHPKVPSHNANRVWIFLNLLLFINLIIFLSAKRLFFVGLLQVVTIVALPLLIFGLTQWQLETTRPLLVLLLLQYLSIPFVFIRVTRQNDKNLILAKEEREKAIFKAKTASKSAKADLGFRIATQIAHDIKSPIMALETVRMMTKSEIKPEVQKLLENSILRINNISDSLLKKFKGGTLEVIHETESSDLIGIIQSLADAFSHTHPNINLRINSSSKKVLVPMDRIDIERTLTNILNNAAEAMSFSGTIQINIQDHSEYAQILVEDTGCGIPKDVQKNIFDTGFTHGKETGTGIGLAQAKDAVEKQGGSISLVSSAPGNTVFKLIIAKSNPLLLEIKTAKNILLVEDNIGTADTWKKIFKDNNKNFIHFATIKSFLDSMTKLNFNVFNGEQYTIITDLIFEGEDETGFEVLQYAQLHSSKYLQNCYLCTTLSSNLDIRKISNEMGAQLIGKKDLDNIKLL